VPAAPRIRVLLVDHVSRVLGGAEVNLLELLAHPPLAARWDVTVACAPDGRLAQALAPLGCPRRDHAFAPALNEMRVVGRRFNPLRQIRGWLELRRATDRLAILAAELRPDALLSCTNKDHFAAGAVGQRLGIPSVWWVNDILSPDFFGWPVRRAFVSNACRLKPRLAAVSRFGRDALVKEGVPASAVTTIHNGIPLDRYRPNPDHSLRAQLGIPAGEPLFGIVGRITPWKGQDVVLRAAVEWARANRPGRFVIIGAAFNEDAPFEQQLREFARHHSLGDRVHFAPFQTDIVAALSSLDILLHASTKPEPFGRVLIEAMAVGIPVVGSRAGGVPEIITDGSDGTLVNPGDVAGLMEAIRSLASDPVLRERRSAAGRATVQRRFGMDRVFAEWDALLHTACGR
jgi:glycosyltransferase involved in cell wall biosynthesis